MDPALEVAAAHVFRAFGIDLAEPSGLERTARGAHIFLESLLRHAVKFSGGSNRSEGNAFDLLAALGSMGTSINLLRCVPPIAFESTEVPVAVSVLANPTFKSMFAKPGPVLPHAAGPRFPEVPVAHLCMSTPQVKEPRDDYVAVRQEQGKELTEMRDALINLRLRSTGGGIEVAGFPHLRVLAHTKSPPYLSHYAGTHGHNPGK